MKQKILVADDVLMDRQVLTTLLEDEFDVVAVEDGEAAVRELEVHQGGFACVLLDIVMPRLDGFGVLKFMREHGYMVPVIALTSITDSEDHIRCYEAGVVELLEKPYDRRILRYKVQKMIGEGQKVQTPAGSAKTVVESAAALPEETEAKMKSMAFKFMMLKAFQKDFSDALVNLRKAIAEHDEPGLHDASHTLSGIEANLKMMIEN